MANCSSQDPALVGSIVSNDCSVKRSDERPSKHYQTEVGCNDYNFYSSSPCIDGWNKSEIWAQNEDDSIKAEAAGWPRWETVSNRSCEKYSLPSDACKNDSTMASKMGWNESEDGNAKKVTGEGYDVIHHDDLDGRRQSSLNIHMVDTCGLSESACWDRQSDGSGKQETDRWPIWPGAISKATWQCNSHQNSTGIQSEEWTMSQDDSTMQGKSGWSDYVDGREKRENDSDAFDRDGRNVWTQSGSNIHIVGKGSLSKSVSWDRAKYENTERKNDGWRRWSGAMSKTNWQCSSHQNRKGCWNQSRGCITPEDGSSMSCKRGWNKSGYRKEERENDGDAFDHDGRDRWRQWRSNILVADKGGLSKSASWDQSKDQNVKRKNDEWPRWSGATSKTTSEDDSSMAFRSGCNESENGKEKCKTADGSDAFDHDDRDGWKPTSSSIRMVDKGSLSFSASWDQAKDDNTKRENDGWARWPGAMSKTFEQFPSHRNRKTISQSRGWTTSDDGDSQKETGGKNPDLGQSGEPWMQHDSVMLQNCDWNTPVSHSASKGDSLVRDQRKWDPGLDQTGGDPWKEIGLAAPPPKACRRKFRSETIAHGENSIRRKSKWSEQCLSSQNRKGGWNQSCRRITSEDGDFLKEINGRIIDLDQSDNRWMEHRPMILPKYDRKKSDSWTESGGDGFEADHMRWGSDLDHTGHDPWERVNPSDLPKFGNPFSEKIKLSAAPDFSDPNALKRNINTFFSTIGGKRPFRGRNRTPYHGYEHEHYQSNDAYRKGRGVSAYYGDSPSGRSQRGSEFRLQIGDAIGKHPDRDTDEFCDNKKARCLGHDGRISFEDPWKQRDHSQDIVFWRHRSHSNGEKRNKSFQDDSSCDRFLRERCSHHDSFNNQGCLAKDESKEICHDNRGVSDPSFESCVDSLRANDVPFHSSLQVMLHGMLQNKSSDDKWDQKNTGKVSSWNVPEVSKTIMDYSHSESHLKIDDEGIRDDTIKFLVTTPKQNLDQNVTNSPYALKSQQKPHACQQSTRNLASHTNDRTDHTTSSPIQFGLNMQTSPRYPTRTKNSYPDGLIQPPASNPDDEAGNHQQQTMLNIPDSSTTQASTVYVSSSDPVFIQANEDPSFNNLCGKLSPAIIRQKASMNSEDVKTRSKKLAPVEPSDKIFNTDTQFVKPEAKQASRICDFSSKSWSACHSETVDIQVNGQSNSIKYEKEEAGANEGFKGGMEDKGIRMFKFALAELVKEMLKPVWKEGRLSKEAHKTVVKKVVDKVVGVLGTNIPKTQERIDLYLSYSKEKLHKLVQDYLEMFINT